VVAGSRGGSSLVRTELSGRLRRRLAVRALLCARREPQRAHAAEERLLGGLDKTLHLRSDARPRRVRRRALPRHRAGGVAADGRSHHGRRAGRGERDVDRRPCTDERVRLSSEDDFRGAASSFRHAIPTGTADVDRARGPRSPPVRAGGTATSGRGVQRRVHREVARVPRSVRPQGVRRLRQELRRVHECVHRRGYPKVKGRPTRGGADEGGVAFWRDAVSKGWDVVWKARDAASNGRDALSSG
jgi:hypothetical protein